MVQTEEALRSYLLETYRVVDGELVRRHTYKQWLAGSSVGTVGKRGYKTLSIAGKRWYVHRLIFLMENGYLPDLVDHKDGVKTNNAPSNLRDADKILNAMNLKGSHRDSKTGVLGVTYRKDSKKYYARLRDKSLGCYDTVEEASLAYITAKSGAT